MAIVTRNVRSTKVPGYGKDSPLVTKVATTVTEAISGLKHFKDEKELVLSAYRARFIETAKVVQTMAREGKVRAEIVKYLDEYMAGTDRVRGASGTSGVSQKQRRAAMADAQDIFALTPAQEKALSGKSPATLQGLLANGVITLEQATKALNGRKFPEPVAKPKADAPKAPAASAKK